jgi:hypothetical protein
MNQKKSYDGPPSHFVNAKRVSTQTDKNGREYTKLTFGIYETKSGQVNTLDELLDVLEQYRGRQVNIEVRTESQDNGYDRAYVRVTEMIPKNSGQAKFTPKTSSKQANIRQQASKFANGVE